jgi:hypothetical protein
VPFATCGTGISVGNQSSYDEVTALGGPTFPDGWRLMPAWISDRW